MNIFVTEGKYVKLKKTFKNFVEITLPRPIDEPLQCWIIFV